MDDTGGNPKPRGQARMIDRRCFLALAGALLIARPLGAATNGLLRLAVLPAMSIRESFRLYADLAEYIWTTKRIHLSPEVARDFPDFFDRQARGQAQLGFGPPHLMRLLEVEHGWHPLVVADPPGSSVLVTLADSPMELEHLRGGTFVALDRDAIIVLAMQRVLAEYGLREGCDYRIESVRGHDSGLMALDTGIAQAMITRGTGFLSPEIRARLTTLLTVDDVPGWILCASPNLDGVERTALVLGLLAFARTASGQAFLGRHGYRGFAKPDSERLKTLDVYLDAARRIAARGE